MRRSCFKAPLAHIRHFRRVDTQAVEQDSSTESAPEQASADSPPPQPLSGRLLASTAVGIGVAAFLATRFASGAPSLSSLEKASVPLDTALANGKPTLLEFYANWCETCRESAPEVFKVPPNFTPPQHLAPLTFHVVFAGGSCKEFSM